ncbi:MAG: TIGR02646 family protein, partial [Thiomargarita sp.]|nr:TIGR02646 family protein [Thiomargarita sp.]
MRYIDKSQCCKEFEDYINKKKTSYWKNVKSNIKLTLHQHLYYEQGGLCIYCQQQLLLKTHKEPDPKNIRSHIEHIRPRSVYSHLTFDYCNLSLACEGFDCSIPITQELPKKEFCEHRKANEYDKEYFLNPVEIKDIENYFFYDDFSFEILPKHEKGSEKFKKAEYMIKILDLNHWELVRMRKRCEQDVYKKGVYDKHDKILPPFYSMLFQLRLLERTTNTIPASSTHI